MDFTYTIIIPTVSREEEFKSTLSSVVSDPFKNLEILIQDNSTQWGLQSYIQSIGDPRIKINRSEKKLSMSENWTEAIDAAKGDYIFILGDDDAWYAGSMEQINNILSSNPETDVISWWRDDYGWPNSVPCIENRYCITYNNSVQRISSTSLLEAVLSGKLSHEFLPKIYSSFQSRKIIESYRSMHGRYFYDQLNVDISTGVQALLHTDTIIRFNLSMSIIGTSSGGGGHSLLQPVKLQWNRDNIKIHQSLEFLAELEANPDLSIVNTYLLIRDAYSMPLLNIDIGHHLYGYITNLPVEHREAACQLILDSGNAVLDAQLRDRLQFILDNNTKISQPASVVSHESFTHGNDQFRLVIDTQKYGLDQVHKAANFGLLLRELWRAKNSQ